MSGNSDNKPPRVSGDLLFAGLFLALSLILLSQLPEQTKWAKKTVLFGQPRFWPTVGLLGMAVFGGAYFWTRFRRNDLQREWLEVANWLRSIEFALWFMIYVWAVPQIGYLLASVIFAPVLAFRMGYRTPKMLLSAFGLGFGTVLIFKSFLSVKIPGGAIYEYLPTALRSFMILNF